jgi:uncharacterized HAD superfamily protein
MQKEIIAIDVDDVLAANAEGFVNFSNRRWGTNLTVEDYDERWTKVWRVDEAEVWRRSDEMHATGVFGEYRHFTDAEEILCRLSEQYKLIVVTSRRTVIQKETMAWLDKHFGGIFDDVVFSGAYDRSDTTDLSERFEITKTDTLVRIGAKYLIDDQLKHCYGAAESNVQAILFGNYSWNQADHLPANVTRCVDWQQVAKFFGV